MKERARSTKICPDCSCDYLAHVETCLDCGTTLLTLEENERLQAEKQRLREEPLQDLTGRVVAAMQHNAE